MYMHEMILSILDEKGSIPIPTLCKELSKTQTSNNYIVHPAIVKSVIRQKDDLFLLKNDLVTINPDKRLVILIADVGDSLGSWFKMKVDFSTKMYTYFEWYDKNKTVSNDVSNNHNFQGHGNIELFKSMIFRSEIWNWKEEYEEEGIVVDGTSWSVKLVTVGKTYQVKGFNSFPENWNIFCSAIQTFTGKPFY